MSAQAYPDPDRVAEAVRRVLPSLNARPETFQLDPRFVRRSQLSPPGVLSLRAAQQWLVLVDIMEGRAEDVAEQAGRGALQVLTDPVRAECERLVVSWSDDKCHAHAAAYELRPDGTLGRQLANSWTDPIHWPTPMFDSSIALEEAYAAALAKVRELAAAASPAPGFEADISRAMSVLSTILASVGGEGQHVTKFPGLEASRHERNVWLTNYEASIQDEWSRVQGTLTAARIRAAPSVLRGPLSGLQAFLSYTRPDATELARPVLEALRTAGADVWFDQDEPLDEGWLDVGLANTIRACDTYILCASDEFFERAGYATQELAWAIESWRNDSRLSSIVVVATPGTVLPRLSDNWPIVERTPKDGGFAAALTAAVRARSEVEMAASSRLRQREEAGPSQVGDSPDVDVLLARVRHRSRLHQLPSETIDRITATGSSLLDASDAAVADRLRRVGDDLDWDGSLIRLDQWPADSLTRAYRWMIATIRAVASARWPLSGNLDDSDDITPDIAVLAARIPPVLEWTEGPCWSDEERRLLLRHHLGALHRLQDLLSAGLCGGLRHVPTAQLNAWERALSQRRRDCIDTLIALRLGGHLSWRAEPPNWDELFGRWWELISHPNLDEWQPPASVLLSLGGQVNTVSALLAQVTWYALRSDEPYVQTLVGGTTARPTSFVGWASKRRKARPAAGSVDRSVMLGLAPDLDGSVKLYLGWRGFEETDGTASASAPEPLAQVMNFESA